MHPSQEKFDSRHSWIDRLTRNNTVGTKSLLLGSHHAVLLVKRNQCSLHSHTVWYKCKWTALKEAPLGFRGALNGQLQIHFFK